MGVKAKLTLQLGFLNHFKNRHRTRDIRQKLKIKFLVTCPMPGPPKQDQQPRTNQSFEKKIEYDRQYENRDVRPG